MKLVDYAILKLSYEKLLALEQKLLGLMYSSSIGLVPPDFNEIAGQLWMVTQLLDQMPTKSKSLASEAAVSIKRRKERYETY